MKLNEETTVSEEQVLFNTLRYEDQELVIKIMKRLLPFELNCELEEEKKIPEKWNDLSFTTMRKKTDSIDDDIEKLKSYIGTIMRTQNEIIDYLESKGE